MPSNPPQAYPISPAFALALLTAGGGITGYVRTGSLPSVIAGCTVGGLYFAGGMLMRNGGEPNYGQEVALLASLILAGSSIPRAIRSGKPLPVGLSVLATFGLVTFGGGVWRAWAPVGRGKTA